MQSRSSCRIHGTSVSRPAARVQESDEYSQTTVQIATGMGQIKMLRNNRIIRKKTIITERFD